VGQLGEKKYFQGFDGESGRKLADDLEDLNVGLSIPLKYIFKKQSLWSWLVSCGL